MTDPALVHSLDLAYALERALERGRPLDLTRALRRAHELSNQLHSPGFHTALDSIVLPTNNAAPHTWQDFATTLQTLIANEFQPAPDWVLYLEQTNRLITYLNTIHLLLDCLDVAIVRDREGIKARLLRPPRGAGGA